MSRSIIKQSLVGGSALLAALAAANSVQAHFTLRAPASWIVEDD
jgi:hypothetical protein